jgi:hypothetical protein
MISAYKPDLRTHRDSSTPKVVLFAQEFPEKYHGRALGKTRVPNAREAVSATGPPHGHNLAFWSRLLLWESAKDEPNGARTRHRGESNLIQSSLEKPRGRIRQTRKTNVTEELVSRYQRPDFAHYGATVMHVHNGKQPSHRVEPPHPKGVGYSQCRHDGKSGYSLVDACHSRYLANRPLARILGVFRDRSIRIGSG